MASYFGSSRGERRKFADNLNLVPFIDLFSTMIIFLLATVIWDQLAGIQTSLGSSGQSSTTSIKTPDEIVKKVTSNVKITVGENYIELFDSGKSERINKVDGVFDLSPLETFVKASRLKYPTKSDIVIYAADTARYDDVVLVLDQCLGQQFSDLVLTGLGGGTL